jgi:hypothetical protein
MHASIEDSTHPLPHAFPCTAKFPFVLRGGFYDFLKCEPSFYAIGKITKNGWRNAFDIAMPNDWDEYVGTAPVPTHLGFDYLGPFFIRCDHGCTHSTESHGTYSNCQGRSDEFRPAGDSSGGLFGGFLSGLFGGHKAGGGPLDPGKWYIAGEHGPEPIWAGGPGAFAAGYGKGNAGPVNNYYIDARGSSITEEQFWQSLEQMHRRSVKDAIAGSHDLQRRR